MSYLFNIGLWVTPTTTSSTIASIHVPLRPPQPALLPPLRLTLLPSSKPIQPSVIQISVIILGTILLKVKEQVMLLLSFSIKPYLHCQNLLHLGQKCQRTFALWPKTTYKIITIHYYNAQRAKASATIAF